MEKLHKNGRSSQGIRRTVDKYRNFSFQQGGGTVSGFSVLKNSGKMEYLSSLIPSSIYEPSRMESVSISLILLRISRTIVFFAIFSIYIRLTAVRVRFPTVRFSNLT